MTSQTLTKKSQTDAPNPNLPNTTYPKLLTEDRFGIHVYKMKISLEYMGKEVPVWDF